MINPIIRYLSLSEAEKIELRAETYELLNPEKRDIAAECFKLLDELSGEIPNKGRKYTDAELWEFAEATKEAYPVQIAEVDSSLPHGHQIIAMFKERDYADAMIEGLIEMGSDKKLAIVDESDNR